MANQFQDLTLVPTVLTGDAGIVDGQSYLLQMSGVSRYAVFFLHEGALTDLDLPKRALLIDNEEFFRVTKKAGEDLIVWTDRDGMHVTVANAAG